MVEGDILSPSASAAETPYPLRAVITVLEVGGGLLLVGPLVAVPFLLIGGQATLWQAIGAGLALSAVGGLYMGLAWGLRRKRQWARIITMVLGGGMILSSIGSLVSQISAREIGYSIAMIAVGGFVLYWFATHPKEFH